MTYNHRKLLSQMDDLLGASPRLPLGKLSEELGVDRHTLEKAVHRIRRKSFRDYQNKKLLRKSLILLAQEGNKSIKDIAMTIGYRTSEPFSRFIKTMTGRSPTEIRNHQRRRVPPKKKDQKDKNPPQMSWF